MEQPEAGEAAVGKERKVGRRDAGAESGGAASEPRRGPKSCSSHFKGVTKHRRTGRWEDTPLLVGVS